MMQTNTKPPVTAEFIAPRGEVVRTVLRSAEFAQSILEKYAATGDFPWNDAQLVLLQNLQAQQEGERKYGDTLALTLNLLRMYITQLPDSGGTKAPRGSGEATPPEQITGDISIHTQLRTGLERGLETIRTVNYEEYTSIRRLLERVTRLAETRGADAQIITTQREELLEQVRVYAQERSIALTMQITEQTIIEALREEIALYNHIELSALKHNETAKQRTGIRPSSLAMPYRRLSDAVGRHSKMPTAKQMFAAASQKQQHEVYKHMLEGFVTERTEREIEQRLGRALFIQERQGIESIVRELGSRELVLLVRNERTWDYEQLSAQILIDKNTLTEALSLTREENRVALSVLKRVYSTVTDLSQANPAQNEKKPTDLQSVSFLSPTERIIGAQSIKQQENADVPDAETAVNNIPTTERDILWETIRTRAPEQFLLLSHEIMKSAAYKDADVSSGTVLHGAINALAERTAEVLGTAYDRSLVYAYTAAELAETGNNSAVPRDNDASGIGAFSDPEKLAQSTTMLSENRYEPEENGAASVIAGNIASLILGRLDASQPARQITERERELMLSVSGLQSEPGYDVYRQTDELLTYSTGGAAATSDMLAVIEALRAVDASSVAENMDQRASQRSVIERNALERIPEWVYRTALSAEKQIITELRTENSEEALAAAVEFIKPQIIERWGELTTQRRGVILSQLQNVITQRGLSVERYEFTAPGELLIIRSPAGTGAAVNDSTASEQRRFTAIIDAARQLELAGGSPLLIAAAKQSVNELQASALHISEEILQRNVTALREQSGYSTGEVVYSQPVSQQEDTEQAQSSRRVIEELQVTVNEQEQIISLEKQQLEELRERVEKQEQQAKSVENSLRNEAAVRLDKNARLPREVMDEIKTRLRIERLRHGAD